MSSRSKRTTGGLSWSRSELSARLLPRANWGTKGSREMEKTPQLTEPGLSDQASTLPTNTPERHEQLPKKDYHRPKLELLGDVPLVTRY